MNKSRGLSLVEVMVAMAIILMVSLACVQVLQFGSKSALASFKRVQAWGYFDQVVNHLELGDVPKLNERYTKFPQIFLNTDYSAEVEISTTVVRGTRLAQVTIRWPSSASISSISDTVTLTAR
jgi:prepilin-type N-terminal cleavage/methylation domain-containing protein